MRISDWSSDVCSSDLVLARRRFAGIGIDRRLLDHPLRGDRLHLGLVIADALEIAEMHEVDRVARRADFLVHLEAALELLVVVLAERAVGRQRERLGLLVEFRSEEHTSELQSLMRITYAV